LDIQEASKS